MNRSQERRHISFAILISLLCLAGLSFPLAAQRIDPGFYSGMRWRLIGPYRAGRVTAVAAIAGNPAIYYIGTPGGGVWKTTDGGTVWRPIFDAERVAPIGALAVAPSDPQIVYVGTGDQSNGAQGQGVYKSTDGGKTWVAEGLADTRIINAVVVDPRNANDVLVGAMGAGAKSQARGVYKSTDGGQRWTRTLFKDDQTGVADLELDPSNPEVVYAALWHVGFGPPGGGRGRPAGPEPNAWIYKSVDAGSTWQPIAGRGLPPAPWGRTGIAVAPSRSLGTGGPRIYAILGQGLFRSDDGGDSWVKTTTDPRIAGSGYFSRIYVDPRNADVVYVMQTSVYRSTDGGRSFEALKGSPGGDDYHVMWIDPENPARMILGVDQGATLSVDGGRTWTPWYNQPTGQFYHVTTGGGFPYYVYGEQQDSGSAAVASRSDFGEIRYRDWFSPGGYEFGYIAADPLNPDLDYAGGEAGAVARYDRRTGQLTYLLVPGRDVRVSGNAPLEFSPLDPHALYFGAQYVLETTDGGVNWRQISPDLTARPSAQGGGPAGAPAGMPARRGRDVISTLGLSPVSREDIWAGTSNGLIQLTRDAGASWENVSPPKLGPRALVSVLEASPFDAGAAYAAIDLPDDQHPYFYRTEDFGKSWRKIDRGLPAFGIARVVRADPVRRGLLYAGTDAGVFVSFDDGGDWQSLELNLPAASIRDLAVHGSDLAAATFGRAFWILDDLTPLREVDAARSGGNAFLYRPEPAYRIRWDRNNDTPLPPEVPAGENPPDGAILDYYLKAAPALPISLAIYDDKGNLVRRFSSAPEAAKPVPANVPSYWFAPPTALPARPGMNRFAWNLRYAHPHELPAVLSPVPGGEYEVYSEVNHVILGKTPRHYPFGPQVVPGTYQVVLTVGKRDYRQPLVVKMDPRISVSQADLVAQLDLELRIARGIDASGRGYHQTLSLSQAVRKAKQATASNSQAKPAADAATALEGKVSALEEGTRGKPGFAGINHQLGEWLTLIEMGDSAPTPSADAVVARSCAELTAAVEAWKQLAEQDVPGLNRLLAQSGYPPVAVPPAEAVSGTCEK